MTREVPRMALEACTTCMLKCTGHYCTILLGEGVALYFHATRTQLTTQLTGGKYVPATPSRTPVYPQAIPRMSGRTPAFPVAPMRTTHHSPDHPHKYPPFSRHAEGRKRKRGDRVGRIRGRISFWRDLLRHLFHSANFRTITFPSCSDCPKD